MSDIDILNAAGVGLIMASDDDVTFADNIPTAADFTETSWSYVSTDMSSPDYLDVISLQTAAGTSPFKDLEVYYDYDSGSDEYTLSSLTFRNDSSETTLTVSDIGIMVSDSVVFGGGLVLGNYGASRNDVFGCEFDDVLYGHELGDKIYGRRGDDMLYGDAGSDFIYGGRGDDFLDGWTGSDKLCGRRGDDILFGGGSNDNLRGGRGDDRLHGDAGYDILFGAPGADTFVFKTGDGVNDILDFNLDKDLVEITEGASGFDDLTISQNGADAEVLFSDVTVVFKDFDSADLTSDSFIFV